MSFDDYTRKLYTVNGPAIMQLCPKRKKVLPFRFPTLDTLLMAACLVCCTCCWYGPVCHVLLLGRMRAKQRCLSLATRIASKPASSPCHASLQSEVVATLRSQGRGSSASAGSGSVSLSPLSSPGGTTGATEGGGSGSRRRGDSNASATTIAVGNGFVATGTDKGEARSLLHAVQMLLP